MIKRTLKKVISDRIPGEWGKEGGNIKVLRTTNFTNEGFIDYHDVVQREISAHIVDKKKLLPGDIIIEKSGGSPNQPVGRVVFFDNNSETFLCNNFTAILRPNNLVIDSKYLFYYLFSLHKKGFTLKFQNKTTGIINLRLDQFLDKIKIPLPPLPEQKRIAAILDKADALRQQDQKLLAAYDELLQAVFLDMFGDPVTNPKGWEKKKVIENADCIVPGRDKPKSFTGKIPWITIDDMEAFGITNYSKKRMGLSEKEISEVKARVIPKGSVLMTCVGELGITSIAGIDMVINQQLHSFQCHEKLNNIFLMYTLSYQKELMYKRATMTTVPYLNKTNCNIIPVIIPPITLQNQFASLVENIESQKAWLQKSIAESEDLFHGLVQRAFKGGV